MDIKTIKANYTLHHTARAARYVSRKIDGIVEPYNGRFGRGYVIYSPAWDSTRFCYKDYYVEK